MVKNQTKVIDIETNVVWRVDRRTRGEDVANSAGKPTPSWTLILSNPQNGERRFINENRIWEFFKLPEAS